MENNYLFTFENYGKNKKILFLALFTALALTMYILEALIPKPVPFLKFGLANIIILAFIITKHVKEAFLIGIMKTIIGGIVMGTLFSPTTVMSISGTIISITIMSCFYYTKIKFSVIGISVIGAVFHNLTQLVIVRFLLILENRVFQLVPLLLIIGLVTGIVTGYITHLFLKRIANDML